MSAWLDARGFHLIDKATRNDALRCHEHRAEIEKYLAVLAEPERFRLNHPTTVLRAWKKATVVPDQNAAPKPSPMAKIKEALIASQEENCRLQRELKRHDGGNIWGKTDTAKNIALTIIANIPSLSKAEDVLREAREILNKKKAELAKAKTTKKTAETAEADNGSDPAATAEERKAYYAAGDDDRFDQRQVQ